MPILKNYDLHIIKLESKSNLDYSLPESEIDKLKNKKIKALIMLNPANPGAFHYQKAILIK